MSRKDKRYKANARREKERVKKESMDIIKRMKKDQFGLQSKKVN